MKGLECGLQEGDQALAYYAAPLQYCSMCMCMQPELMASEALCSIQGWCCASQSVDTAFDGLRRCTVLICF